MTAITRRALRVCTALIELRGRGGDVLDALLPFFEPILQAGNGKVFDPSVFAIGVQKLYRWRFTRDIAEQLIPRFERAGFLERVVGGKEAIFIVRYSVQNHDDNSSLGGRIDAIIDEFQKFPPRITDLLSYKRTREELTDILIRFLVSLDAYAPATFSEEVRKLELGSQAAPFLSQIEEGGTPLAHDDKYMAARFVQYMCEDKREYVDDLAHLASIGLLTEVVEDFVKPVQPATRSDLSVIVDAPLALDYLGCSGNAAKTDVRTIFDSLRQIGCKFVVLPVTCAEIQRNLRSMLANAPADRHGYTHGAIVRNEVTLEYVQAVANDPEKALVSSGITLKPISMVSFPSQHHYFSDQLYEDFFQSIVWVADIAPREHDATCLALTTRLRAGQRSSDIFRCQYVFATRNPRFVRDARSYCLTNRLLDGTQESPVIHQRELATIAWLRTGLGASEIVPRGHLLAICDRVLNLRKEVREAVGQKLRALTPDKLEQYELLLLDQRSLRRLADQTLNDEKVITDENAELLLEAMRRAAIEEARLKFEKKLRDSRAEANAKLSNERARTAEAEDSARKVAQERDSALKQLAEQRDAQRRAIEEIARKTTVYVRRVGKVVTTLVWILAAVLASNYLFGWLTTYRIPTLIISILLALYGSYHQLANFFEKPKIGLPTVLGWLAKRTFASRVVRAGLADKVRLEEVGYARGVIELNETAISQR